MTLASAVQTHQWIRVMGKRCERPSKQTIFDDNPLIDGFLEWIDSPESEPATELLDTLNLQQSIEHIQKQCPDFSVEEIEGHLLYWVESGYSSHNCSQE